MSAFVLAGAADCRRWSPRRSSDEVCEAKEPIATVGIPSSPRSFDVLQGPNGSTFCLLAGAHIVAGTDHTQRQPSVSPIFLAHAVALQRPCSLAACYQRYRKCRCHGSSLLRHYHRRARCSVRALRCSRSAQGRPRLHLFPTCHRWLSLRSLRPNNRCRPRTPSGHSGGNRAKGPSQSSRCSWAQAHPLVLHRRRAGLTNHPLRCWERLTRRLGS